MSRDAHPRLTVGEALDTALGALAYASRCQRTTPGRPQEFHDWGWTFVEVTETLHAATETLDRQLADHVPGPVSATDHNRIQQIRTHLALLNRALADAETHARGFYPLVARLGSEVPHGS